MAGKLLCDKAETDEEKRAITVDEMGEFRLWNIHVKEKTSEAYLAPTLQIFEMHQPESPMNRIKYLMLPHDPTRSTGYYSNLVACGTKLLMFLPEKNAKEFVPPACILFSDPAAAAVTCVGKALLKYDISTGNFLHAMNEFSRSDLTALCLDGIRGR
jgi:hypothetical protein